MAAPISNDVLFPIPSRPPAPLSPAHWPGISPTSTKVLLDVLKHNHDHWHTFTNEKHFHNHAPHRSLALWSFGADGEVIRAGYEKDCGNEKRAMTPPGHITDKNFIDHLGDERYYHAYVDFFANKLQRKGVAATLEDYLFGPVANVGAEDTPLAGGKHPEMLARLFAGVFHPLIHTGYGVEFGLPGLAQTAVHPSAGTSPLVPPSLFDSSTYSTLSSIAESTGHALHNAFEGTISSLDHAFDSLLSRSVVKNLQDNLAGTPHASPEAHSAAKLDHLEEQTRARKAIEVHALDILGWVAQDMRFAPPRDPKDRDSFDGSIGRHAETLLKFSRLWKLDVPKLGSDAAYLDRKLEELAFVVAVMYGVGGWTGRAQKTKDGKAPSPTQRAFNADFFLMHLVTSSVFLPSLCAFLTPPSRARLLHTYLALALATYVFRGCPPLDIVGFYKSTTKHEPGPVGPQPHPGKGTLPDPDSEKAVNPDPWLPIVQTSMVHPDEHVPKTQRSLANWAAAFGMRRFSAKCDADPFGLGNTKAKEGSKGGREDDPGMAESAGLGLGWGAQNRKEKDLDSVPLEIKGAEYLDGTVFLRVAELTAQRMRRVREGEDEGEFWDFRGFYGRDEEGEGGIPKALL